MMEIIKNLKGLLLKSVIPELHVTVSNLSPPREWAEVMKSLFMDTDLSVSLQYLKTFYLEVLYKFSISYLSETSVFYFSYTEINKV